MIARRQLLAVAPALLAGCAARRASAPRLETFAASLPWETVTGEPFDARRLEGRVVLITFIATWCFPCVADLLSLTRLEALHGAKGFANVLVGMDLEGPLVLAPFARQYELTMPLLAADAAIRSGGTAFGPLRELPARLLFGRDAALVTAFTGVARFQDLERLIVDELART